MIYESCWVCTLELEGFCVMHILGLWTEVNVFSKLEVIGGRNYLEGDRQS